MLSPRELNHQIAEGDRLAFQTRRGCEPSTEVGEPEGELVLI